MGNCKSGRSCRCSVQYLRCLPNTSPVNDNRGVNEFIVAEARRNAAVNVLPIAAVTKNSAGEELTDMADLIDSGAVAFSDDGRPIQNSELMRRALDILDQSLSESGGG